MPHWSEDFSERSLDEIFRSQAENRAWNKGLRLRNAALTNSRLAKEISREEYLASRKLTDEEAVECKRRAGILSQEIADRRMTTLRRPAAE